MALCEFCSHNKDWMSYTDREIAVILQGGDTCMGDNISYSTYHKWLNINLRVLAKSLRVRIAYSQARVLCSWAEVLCLLSYARVSCNGHVRTLRVEVLYCEWKYYMRMCGTNWSLHAPTRTHALVHYSGVLICYSQVLHWPLANPRELSANER